MIGASKVDAVVEFEGGPEAEEVDAYRIGVVCVNALALLICLIGRFEGTGVKEETLFVFGDDESGLCAARQLLGGLVTVVMFRLHVDVARELLGWTRAVVRNRRSWKGVFDRMIACQAFRVAFMCGQSGA